MTGDSSGAVTAGRLRSHLETSYGIEVSGLAELDAGVFRVARADGPDWVARLFPAAPAGRGGRGRRRSPGIPGGPWLPGRVPGRR